MTEAQTAQLQAWISNYSLQVIATGICLLAYFLMTRFAFPRIEKGVEQGKFKSSAAIKAFHVVRLLAGIVIAVVLIIVWGVDFSGLLLLSTSIITLTGIALFASWSILSNITAYFVLLLHQAYRRGNYIRVIDADNYIEGYISEVNVFNTRLITEDREVVIYPNNLLISRPALMNPRKKMNSVGKIFDLPPSR
jgi:small-conductance mechanosensitive channel